MHAEPLFVFTLHDLRARISMRTYYDTIRAAGLLRHLLLDQEPLVIQANRSDRRKIRFEILATGAWMSVQSSDGRWRFATSTIGPVSAEASDEGFTEVVPLSRLLKTPLLRWDDREFTVADIIRLAAHVQGGVHLGSPAGEREALLHSLAYMDAFMGQPAFYHCLIQIVRVVSDSLKGMEDALATKWKIKMPDTQESPGT